MRVSLLASGSAGNASLFRARDGTTVLVDAGLSPRALQRSLKALGHSLPQALVITHAHSDHIAYARAIVERWQIPLHMTEGAARAAGLFGHDALKLFSPKEPFAVGGLIFSPLPLPHDTPQVALRISADGVSTALCTDLGEVPSTLPGFLARADLLLIEANHDEEMLERGPYPETLKRRIASARGHLSNRQTETLLRALPSSHRQVVLMHLSETNNRPELALAAAHAALGEREPVWVAPQRQTMSFEVAGQTPMRGQLQFVFS